MSDTRWTSLGILLKETSGSIKTGPFGTVLKAAEYSQQGVPVISVGEVGHGSLRITDSTRRVGPEVVRRLPEYVLRGGDVVFGRKGAVDRSAHVRESEDGYFLGSDGIRVRFGVTVDPQFMVYQLQSAKARDWLIQNAVGTTMPSLNQAVLGRLPIRVPSIEEQHAVARILGDADELIVSLECYITKKQAIKQGMMQQLLTGRTRLPCFTGNWKMKSLQHDISLISGHHVLARYCNTDGRGVPYLTGPADFPDGHIQQTKFTDKPTSMCQVGDVLVTVKGSGAGTLVQADSTYCISRQLMAIRTKEWNPRFLFYSLLENASSVREAATGLIPGLSRSDILNLKIPVPSVAEQDAIAAVILDGDLEIASLHQRLAKARSIKQGMMQQLLTGRTRLPIPEAAA